MIFMDKGTIALDIDGTITGSDHLIPAEVADYFETLHSEGWQFVFVTGRPLSFAMMALPKLSFPYLLGVQNGADLLEMPSKKSVDRAYLGLDIVEMVDGLYEGCPGDFLVYSGYEKGDICYYRPDRFPSEMQGYLEEIQKLSGSPWKPVTDFNIEDQQTFPVIKCIGPLKMLEGFYHKLQELEELKATLIRDPISGVFHLILITHKDANKGAALATFVKKYGLKKPVIAGGDDNNDIPLLEQGDVRIVMEGAPNGMGELAHIMAPPAYEMGIIEGIQKGMEWWKKNGS
ncbi:HAD family hydrolase [Candidatus Neptunochlamydia vexilliferae]|uniref:Uncharacterized protein n=1 Tax=Candidatus Neptunichlamydia vexilliferae TaxID=1651774 RepID=A0ABS0B141_9BACT|nr:HAD family hydrolase [Candidatus Neptunochlamydia vexilliferae]MBF5060109.1 hypothetical protein [Candidatus Neptunochlamydia vexilliferae]